MDEKEKQHKKFEKNLPEEWRNQMMSAQRDEVEKAIRESAMSFIQNDFSLKYDPDIRELKEKLSYAREPYMNGKKVSMLKVEFLMETLRSQGVDVPSITDYINSVRNGDE